MLKRVAFRPWVLSIFITLGACWAADIPHQGLQTAPLPETNRQLYYWQPSSVGDTAQLLTLFCRSCLTSDGNQLDVPLLAVLRDTLGDNHSDNDRVTYVWLLTYSRLNIGQKALSAVPFFYWRVGQGAASVSPRDTKPLFDLTQPQHPVMSELGRDLLQWTLLDPMTTPVRASSRAYRTNELDHERLHLEEAVSYLREAPVSGDASELTDTQRNTVMARLELRKRLLGGLVAERHAAAVGEESGFEQERIRSRNWELLRQCAEKTGLIFEPIDLAGTAGQYAILWFPRNGSLPSAGTSLSPVWKLLNIKDPWSDSRLKAPASAWNGPVYVRALDANGSLLPIGQSGVQEVRLVPLSVYGLNYPSVPLLLVDFRSKLHVRWHEMTQRSINEITAGVIGISHFTNWYYYVAADLYDFVIARRGAAMNQAARLDSYSQFRVKLALDHEIDPRLRQDMQSRVNSLAINPLEAAPRREMEAARARYAQLQLQAQEGGALISRLDKQRRAELAAFGDTKAAQVTHELLHYATFGLYTERVKDGPSNLAMLDRDRTVQYHLNLLDSLAEADTQPEIAYDGARIRASVVALSSLMPSITSREVRVQVQAVLLRLKSLSQDQALQSDCTQALASLEHSRPALHGAQAAGILTSAHPVVEAARSLELAK